MKLPWRIFLIGCLIVILAAAALGPRTPAAQAQAACTELIQNGGFETNAAWILGKDPVPPQYVTYTYHTPSRSMALGIVQGANKESYSSVRQQVTVSPAADQVRLSFWFYPKFTNSVPATDWIQLFLLFPGGAKAPLWNSFNTGQMWNQMQFDLSPYRGRTFTVYFNAYNDGLGGTAGMFLDDVSLVSCSGATSTSTSAPATATRTPTRTPAGCLPVCPPVLTPCLPVCPATLTPTRTPTRTPAGCLPVCSPALTPCLPGCPATLTPTRTPTRTRIPIPSLPACTAPGAPCYATSTPMPPAPTVRPSPTARATRSLEPADMTARAPSALATSSLEPADMTARAPSALGPMPPMTHVALEGAPPPSLTSRPIATATPIPTATPTPRPAALQQIWDRIMEQVSGLPCIITLVILAVIAFLIFLAVKP